MNYQSYILTIAVTAVTGFAIIYAAVQILL
jgi:hypothetical protein